MAETLALLGGKPILKTPFPVYNSLGKEEEVAATKVMQEGIISDFLGKDGDKFLGGKYVQKFERAIEKYFKVKHAVSFNSATTALQSSVAALGIEPGDEVITSPYTMSATAAAILLNNALPVFADIDQENFCLDPKSVEAKITPKTKAILMVNIFGGTGDFDGIIKIAKKHKLKIIEDNAQSAGAKYKNKFLGTLGDMGVFSFNVHKTLQCGEGGVLVTNNDKLAYRAQLARNHGEVIVDDRQDSNQKEYEPIVGSNYRLSELHAAVAIEQMKKIDQLNKPRIKLARYLYGKLEKFKLISIPNLSREGSHVYYVFPFKFKEKEAGIKRETFAEAMQAEGFPLSRGYVKPIYLMALYQKRKILPKSQFPFNLSNIQYKKGDCPVCEKLYEKELLTTGICNSNRTLNDIDLFVKAINKVFANLQELKEYESKA